MSLMLAGAALVQTGSTGAFTIQNHTRNNTLVGFHTNDGTGQSNYEINFD